MLEILTYDFMQRAVLAVIAISIFAPILGVFLILRRQSLMSDTLSTFPWRVSLWELLLVLIQHGQPLLLWQLRQ